MDKNIENKKKAFSILIKQLREKNKLTQEKLSIASGISRQHLSEIETKGTILSITTQEALALSFNISYSRFSFLFEEEYKRQLELENIGISKEEYLKVAEQSKMKKYNVDKDK